MFLASLVYFFLFLSLSPSHSLSVSKAPLVIQVIHSFEIQMMWMELQGALGHSSHEQNAQEKEEVDVEVQYVVTCIDPLLELLLAANKQRDNCEVDGNTERRERCDHI